MPDHLLVTEVPSSLRRRVRTLGHGLFKLSEAWSLLGVRLDRGLLDGETTAWIKKWCVSGWQQPLALPLDASALAVLVWAGKAWQVESLEGEETAGAWWMVLMLLQLPALRAFWKRALRSQRFAWMSKALPPVWALDTQAVIRPGTVIAGLGIASWEALPNLIRAGRTFEVISVADGAIAPVDAAGWPGLLGRAGEQPLLLRERFPYQPDGHLKAAWQRNEEGRIVLLQDTPVTD